MIFEVKLTEEELDLCGKDYRLLELLREYEKGYNLTRTELEEYLKIEKKAEKAKKHYKDLLSGKIIVSDSGLLEKVHQDAVGCDLELQHKTHQILGNILDKAKQNIYQLSIKGINEKSIEKKGIDKSEPGRMFYTFNKRVLEEFEKKFLEQKVKYDEVRKEASKIFVPTRGEVKSVEINPALISDTVRDVLGLSMPGLRRTKKGGVFTKGKLGELFDESDLREKDKRPLEDRDRHGSSESIGSDGSRTESASSAREESPRSVRSVARDPSSDDLRTVGGILKKIGVKSGGSKEAAPTGKTKVSRSTSR